MKWGCPPPCMCRENIFTKLTCFLHPRKSIHSCSHLICRITGSLCDGAAVAVIVRMHHHWVPEVAPSKHQLPWCIRRIFWTRNRTGIPDWLKALKHLHKANKNEVNSVTPLQHRAIQPAEKFGWITLGLAASAGASSPTRYTLPSCSKIVEFAIFWIPQQNANWTLCKPKTLLRKNFLKRIVEGL